MLQPFITTGGIECRQEVDVLVLGEVGVYHAVGSHCSDPRAHTGGNTERGKNDDKQRVVCCHIHDDKTGDQRYNSDDRNKQVRITDETGHGAAEGISQPGINADGGNGGGKVNSAAHEGDDTPVDALVVVLGVDDAGHQQGGHTQYGSHCCRNIQGTLQNPEDDTDHQYDQRDLFITAHRAQIIQHGGNILLAQFGCILGLIQQHNADVTGNGTDDEPGKHGLQPEHPAELRLNVFRQKPHDDVGEERCAEHRLAEQSVACIHGRPQTGHPLGAILETEFTADIGRHCAHDGNLGNGGRDERTDEDTGAQQRQHLTLKGRRADAHDAQSYTRQQAAFGDGGADAHGSDEQPYRGAGKAAEGSGKRDNTQKYPGAAHDEYADKIGNDIGDPVDDRPKEQSHSPHCVLLQPFGGGNKRDGETDHNSQCLKYDFLLR